MKSLLTPGQQGLLRVLVALGAFMISSSVYLWVSAPTEQVIPAFYQWMLLAHIYVGILMLVPMAGFILWHFTVVLKRRHPSAVWTGVAIAAAALIVTGTGLYIREEANT
ncbi:MAG: hypothetical protein ACYTG4_00670, partial [Planctomycetota bacterium]